MLLSILKHAGDFHKLPVLLMEVVFLSFIPGRVNGKGYYSIIIQAVVDY